MIFSRWTRTGLILAGILVLALLWFKGSDMATRCISLFYISASESTFLPGQCEYSISFTSIPPRLFLVPVLIRRLNDLPESIRPRQVFLTISKHYRRFPDEEVDEPLILHLKSLKVDVLLSEDRGPINKLLGALRSPWNSTLIMDDERYLADGVFSAACTQAKSNAYWIARNMPASALPILSFFKTGSYLHLMGSYGYLLPKDESMMQAMLDVDRMRRSIFGLYEDDLWISCLAMKVFNHTVSRIHFNAESFFVSQISNSRRAGLIERFGGQEDDAEWDIRYHAFVRGGCYDRALNHSKRQDI